MNQNDPSGLTRMLDDFRSGTKLQYSRRSSTHLTAPVSLPVPLTPQTQAKVKRAFDDTVLNENDFLIKKSKKDDSILSDTSLDDSLGGSSWEISHLKSQLSQARAEIKTWENRVAQLHGLRKDVEHNFEQEKTALKMTIDQDRNNIQQLERRARILKKREERLKDELNSMIEKMNSERNERESKNIALYDENTQLKHEISQLEDANRELLQKMKGVEVEKSRLETELSLCSEKCSVLCTEMAALRRSSAELEAAKAHLAKATLTIQELESEKQSCGEMAAMVRSQQAKLLRFSELERQLKQYIHHNSKLKENCSNVVHLESVMEEMKSRLSTLEEREKELVQLRVELGMAEGRLAEFRGLGDALGSGATATQLGTYLRQLQSSSLQAASHQSQMANKLKNLEEQEKTSHAEISSLKQEIEKLKEDVQTTNNSLRRLKKQNALVTWERNDLRCLIDSCNKEVTISGGHIGSGASGQHRVELLEKLVEGYRERTRQMEADPSLITPAQPQGSNLTASKPGDGTLSSAEMEKLRSENRDLKEKIEKYEFEMEHRSLKGDFNTLSTKILHFKLNPVDEAVSNREDELEKLKKELFETKERLKMYMEGQMADVTQEIATRQDLNREVVELREKVRSQETVNQRLKEAFKTKGHEFREAIYNLLGYKVDGLQGGLYRLSNLYADSSQQHLIFKMSAGGHLELLETDYSRLLQDLVESVLVQSNSIPVFLSTLTVDLFKKQADPTSSSSSIALLA